MAGPWNYWNTTTSATASSVVVYADSHCTWAYWCTDGTSSATDNGTWQTWCTVPTTSAGDTWTTWVSGTTDIVDQSETVYMPPPEPTEEQRAEWARLDEERRRRQEEGQRQIATANERAEQLLRETLTEEEYQQLEELGHLIIQTAEHRYKIRKDNAYVREIDEEGKEIAGFCIHPKWTHKIPVPDKVLLHKLMLECDEEEWLRIANKTVYDYARDRV